MTQDEIIRMAREAGAYRNKSGAMVFIEDAMLERFTALVAAHEREKQAEQEPVLWGDDKFAPHERPQKQEPVANKYNHKRIGWELERTAQGESYYGNALYVAIDFPFLNRLEKDCLHRYMHGSETPNDRFVLQDIAMKVYSEPEADPVRTKDLTDDDVAKAYMECTGGDVIARCRAVIAADREKNK